MLTRIRKAVSECTAVPIQVFHTLPHERRPWRQISALQRAPARLKGKGCGRFFSPGPPATAPIIQRPARLGVHAYILK